MTNLERLLRSTTRVVIDDLKHIKKMVKEGKLPATAARDLAIYMRLLNELVKINASKPKDDLSGKSTEELKQLAKDMLEEAE